MARRSLGSLTAHPGVLATAAVATALGAFVTGLLLADGARGYGVPSLFYLALILATLAVGKRAALLAAPVLTAAYLVVIHAQGASELELLSSGVIRLGVSLLIGALVGASVDHTHDVARSAQRQAAVDALTGLGNRRALEAAWAQLGGAPAGVLMIDMDGLKPINDGHGHAAGDAALRDVAEAIVRSVRPSDTVARVGGDEFVVLTGSTGSRDVRAMADRIDRNVARAGVSVSIGIAVAPLDGGDLPTLLAVADARMYERKSALHARSRREMSPPRATAVRLAR